MQYDIFFSISQTPVDGALPSEQTMFANFFEQVMAADEQGFGVAWIAESHLSSQVQKLNPNPVIPHWEGEVGLNVDFLQLSHQVFRRTRRIETGAAVMNILCMGGPMAAAERVAAFCALHGVDPAETRKINVGFAAGRFDFMNAASGIVPRNPIEVAAGRVFKHKTFTEACHIFLRLLRGDIISSADIPRQQLQRSDFRTDEAWQRVVEAAGEAREHYEMAPRWVFDKVKIVPQQWRRELLNLVIGTHAPELQEEVNTLAPVQVFNLSITKPEVIEGTHARMREAFHADGGPWKRAYMPRTTFVFINEQDGLTDAQKRERANTEAREALGAYWKALQGTIDPTKVENAANNALIGNAEDIAQQMVERFHPEDRLMLWFDFFNHDCARVIANQDAFMTKVAPRVAELLAAR